MMNRQFQIRGTRAACAATPLIAVAALALLTTAPRAAQAAPPLGINSDWNYDWSPQQMFIDVIKQARGFGVTVPNGGPAGDGNADGAPRDANGWPTTDTIIAAITEPANAADWGNGGSYSVQFNGYAAHVFDYGNGTATVTNQSYNTATNTTTLTLVEQPGVQFVWPEFDGTVRTGGPGGTPNTGITNLSIIRPGYTLAQAQSLIFTNDFIQKITPFACYRTMNLTEVNSDVVAGLNYPTAIDWSNRRTPGYPLQQGEQEPAGLAWPSRFHGVSWEYLVAIANKANTDIWINIPAPASDSYITNLAQLLRYGSDGVNPYTSTQASPVWAPLHAGGHVYVELANEIWNGLFYSGTYLRGMGSALGTGGSFPEFTETGNRTAQISNIFSTVWGAPAINNTIRVVLPGQNGNTGVIDQAAQYIQTHYGPVKNYVYGFATAPYYQVSGAFTEPAVLSGLSTASANNVAARTSDITEANAYGVFSLAYEGGPDMSLDNGPAQSVLNAASVDPNIIPIMVNDLQTNWFNLSVGGSTGGLYMFYEVSSNWCTNNSEPAGNWGLSQTPNASDMTNPAVDAKWQAIFQVLGTSGSGLAAPTGFVATAGNAQVVLSWNTSSGATSYNVLRSTVSGSGYAQVINLPGTSYTNTGLTNGVTYYFVVNATNGGATSPNSIERSAMPSGPNLALNKTATADASQASTPPQNGNDGSMSTKWCAPDGLTGHWWKVDLGAVDSLTSININWEQVNAYKYKVETSADNSTWTTIVDKTGNTTASNSTVDPVSASGRYVRITITGGVNGGLWACFYEAQVLGTTGGSAPPAPAGLTATSGNAQVALSWSASSGATSYNVKHSTVSGSGYVTVSSPTVTNYTNTGLTNGTTYYFVVTAVNANGESGNSNQASATPQPSAPPAPTGLTATPGNAQVPLSWTASTGATSYNVKRSTVSGSGYATVSSPATTSYTDTGLTNGTTYYYVVTAVSGGGESGNSNQASATPAASAPAPPTGLTATAGNSQAALSWTASSGATSYNVLRSTVNGSGYASVVTGLSTTSYTNTGLTNGTTYYFVVTATNTGGTSGNSNQASATPPSSGGTNLALNKTASTDSTETGHPASGANDGNTTTRWTANDGAFPHWWLVDLGASSTLSSSSIMFEAAAVWKYKIEVSPDSTTWTMAVDRTANATSAQTFADTFAATGRYVRITVTGASGGFWASIFEAQIIGTTGSSAPPAPTGLTATSGNSQAALSWTASPGATSYNVLRSTVSGSGYASVATGIAPTTYTNTGLTNGTTYYFVVTATNSTGTSGNSNQASATPQLPIPPAPTGLTATPGNTQIALSWTASTGATSYSIYRGTTAGGESGTAIATGIATTSYTNTGLTNGTAYYFTVKAVNTSGTSGASNEASGSPSAGVNLVPDPGFESGQGGWYFSYSGTGNDPVLSTTAAHSGTNGVSIGGNYANISETVTGLTPNTTYTLTAWGRLINSATGNNVSLNITGYGGSQINTWVTTTTYTQYTVSFTTGASNTSAVVGFGFQNGSTCGAYCDDFNLH